MSVSSPPVIVDLAAPAKSSPSIRTYFGPFENGSALYLIQQSVGTPFRQNVYKSTDGGVTWATQDSGNRPTSADQRGSVVRVGNVLYILYAAFVGGALTVSSFNMSTDLWVAPSNSGLTTDAEIILAVSNGDIYTLRWLSGSSAIHYATFIGGVWANGGSIVSSVTQMLGAIVDSNDLIHFWFRAAGGIRHRTLTTGGVVGASSDIQAFGGAAVGPPSIWTDPGDGIAKLIIPSEQPPASATSKAGYYEGDPATATSPTWSFVPVETTLDATWESSAEFSFVDGAGVLYLFWIMLDFSPVDPADIIDRMYYAFNDGSGWSAPFLFYDEVAFPQEEDPGIDPYDQFLHTLSAVKLADGSFGVATALEENSFCAGYYLIDGGSDLAISCNNPPNGAINVLYSHSVTASGGTAPYTFALTAGALPTGLVLTSGGLISGLPTVAGTFAFTVQVTDAALNTAEVECSITIEEGGGLESVLQYLYGNAQQLVCDTRYPWLIPPSERTPWKQDGSIQAPALAVISQIWEYQVPDGFYLVLDRIWHAYDPPGLFVDGAGAVIWVIDVDSPITSPLATWRPVAQFTGMIGSTRRPFPVGPLQFRGGDTLRYKVAITDPAVPVGPPNMISATAEGWLYPVARSLV